MGKEELEKIFKYRPPLLISFVIILGFFLLFLYLSKDRYSYAISDTNNSFSDSFEMKSVSIGISSDKGIKANRMYDNNRQVFNFNIDDNYGSSYVKSQKIEDSGLLYILSNSYPNIDIKDKNGDSLNVDFQTWISQVTIWLYLNEKGVILDNEKIEAIKTSKKIYVDNDTISSDKTIYETYIKDTVDNALKVKAVDKKLNVFTDDKIYMTKDNKYYQSSLVSVSFNDSENFKGYTVNLDNAPKGSIIVDEDGKKINTNSRLKVTDKFYLRVPKDKVSRNATNIELNISGIYSEIEAYSYTSEGYSDLISSIKIDKEISESLYIKF